MCCFLDDSDSEMSDMELLDEAELGGFMLPEADEQLSVRRMSFDDEAGPTISSNDGAADQLPCCPLSNKYSSINHYDDGVVDQSPFHPLRNEYNFNIDNNGAAVDQARYCPLSNEYAPPTTENDGASEQPPCCPLSSRYTSNDNEEDSKYHRTYDRIMEVTDLDSSHAENEGSNPKSPYQNKEMQILNSHIIVCKEAKAPKDEIPSEELPIRLIMTRKECRRDRRKRRRERRRKRREERRLKRKKDA